MDILDQIIAFKRKEVDERKRLFPLKLLEQSIFFQSQPVSLKKYLLREDKSGIIAEIKRKSPSKGIINDQVSVEQVSVGYIEAGASALSVLTDNHFFGGTNEDLTTARKFNSCPILRKDFIVDAYQITEAKSIGADVILLIASVLDPETIRQFARQAHELGMEVLLEVHNEEEVRNNLESGADAIGVNNRNLKTFEVNIETSIQLAEVIPRHFLTVSESGLEKPANVVELKKYGYKGFLIGESFMKYSRPELACKEFIDELK